MIYKDRGFFVCRSAVLSLADGLRFTKNYESLKEALSDPEVNKALQLSAPSLYERIIQNPSERNLQNALFKIVSRMSFRSAPYGSFGAVSFGSIAQKSVSEISLERSSAIYARQLPQQDVQAEASALALNPTARWLAGQVVYTRLVDKPRRYTKTQLELPLKLKKILLKDPNSLRGSARNQLVRLGLLQAALTPAQKKYKRAEYDDIRPIAKRDRKVDLQLWRETKVAVLSQKKSEQILSAATVITRIFNRGNFLPIPFHRGQKIAELFSELYEYREIPLLDVVADSNPIGRLLREPAEDKFAPPWQFDKTLLELMTKQNVINGGILKLAKADIDELTQALDQSNAPLRPWPETLTAFSEMLDNDQIRFKFALGQCGAGNMMRPALMNSELGAQIKKQISDEGRLRGQRVPVEIMHEPEFGLASAVYPETQMADFKLPLSRVADSRSKALRLEDIRVSIEKGTFQLRCVKTDKFIMPYFPSAYNGDRDAHPVFRFLYDVEQQTNFRSVTWYWGTFLKHDVLPRVEYGQVILQPAMWRLSKDAIGQLKRFQSNDKRRAYLSNRNIPSQVTVVNEAEFRRFNIADDLGLEELMRCLETNGQVFLEEVLPTAKFVHQKGQPNSHDILLPFSRVESELPPARRATVEKIPINKIVFAPGSDCTYLKIYFKDRVLDLALTTELHPFVKKMKSSATWFFINYLDPEPHLRLRTFGSDGRKLLKVVERWVLRGLCERFEIATYRREIERYGGLKACELFETLSYHDSCTTLEVLEIIRSSQIARDQVIAWAAFLSVQNYFEDFALSKNELRKFGASRAPKVRNPTTVMLNLLKSKKSQSLLSSQNEVFEQLSAIYAARRLRQKNTIARLQKLFSADKVETTKAAYVATLMHLSLNRLDLQFMFTYEATLISDLKGWYLSKGSYDD